MKRLGLLMLAVFMLTLVVLTVLGLAVSIASAGQLRNTFTAPGFESSVTGVDTCAAGTVAISTTLTIRRTWTGPTSGVDSLVAVLPGTACVMTAGVPTGSYTVTVDSHGTNSAASWSCATTGSFLVRGKPAKITNLGEAMLNPRRLPDLLAARVQSTCCVYPG
jgi:hypothetical protein